MVGSSPTVCPAGLWSAGLFEGLGLSGCVNIRVWWGRHRRFRLYGDLLLLLGKSRQNRWLPHPAPALRSGVPSLRCLAGLRGLRLATPASISRLRLAPKGAARLPLQTPPLGLLRSRWVVSGLSRIKSNGNGKQVNCLAVCSGLFAGRSAAAPTGTAPISRAAVSLCERRFGAPVYPRMAQKLTTKPLNKTTPAQAPPVTCAPSAGRAEVSVGAGA